MSREGDAGVSDAGTVLVTFLEMASPAAHRPSRPLPNDVSLHREPENSLARMAGELYRAVGGPWAWTDRRQWTEADWQALVARPGVELWTARRDDTILGYFQLHHDDETVELKYFGLLPAHLGQGLGGPLLSAAVRRAWELGPNRITLNTCSLDHPGALPNYLARGFAVVRSESRVRPDHS